MPTSAEHTPPSPDQPVPDEFDLLCEGCGYSLVGLMSDRCPECGATFDPTLLPLARVPWLYRRRLGRVKSYVQTCWRIITGPTAFAREMCRPIRISMQDARLFRRLSIRIVMVTVLAVVAAGAAINVHWANVWARTDGDEWVMMIAGIVFGIPLLYALLHLATDLPTFIWQGLTASPHDLAPLHYYAAAPLCLVPVVVIPGGVLLQYAQNLGIYQQRVTVATIIAMLFGGVVILLLLWWLPQRLMKQATACGPGRVIGLATYLPAHWMMMTAMCGMAFALAMYLLAMLLGGAP